MTDYTDEGFREAIRMLRSASAMLVQQSEAIDRQEPIRQRIDAEVETIERALDKLDEIYHDAVDELL